MILIQLLGVVNVQKICRTKYERRKQGGYELQPEFVKVMKESQQFRVEKSSLL